MSILSSTSGNSNSIRKSPQLLVVFTLDGMGPRVINTNTAEEEAELEKRFQRILPGLAAVNEVWQQDV